MREALASICRDKWVEYSRSRAVKKPWLEAAQLRICTFPRPCRYLTVRKIVVIDDDEMVGELTAALLSTRGFEVQLANSGATGLELVRATSPDAVLCDMRMPGMGGHQVLLALKSQPATHQIPVVFMSGQCDDDLVGKGDAFVWKPFNADQLAATIEQLIAKRGLLTSVSASAAPSSARQSFPPV